MYNIKHIKTSVIGVIRPFLVSPGPGQFRRSMKPYTFNTEDWAMDMSLILIEDWVMDNVRPCCSFGSESGVYAVRARSRVCPCVPPCTHPPFRNFGILPLKWLVTQKYNFFVGFLPSVQDFFLLNIMCLRAPESPVVWI